MRTALRACSAVLALLAGTAACSSEAGDPSGLGTASSAPQPSTRTGEPSASSPAPSSKSAQPPQRKPGTPRVVGTVATGLRAPWGVTFLPDGSALVGERDTTRVVSVRSTGRSSQVRTVGRVEGVSPQGEAGLLGLATSPSYASDKLVYAYLSTDRDNRVVTMTYDGRSLGPPRPVLTGIPNGFIHDGGRLLFAPDGTLFVSTGEIGDEQLAQDRSSLAGKILRITADGEPAPGNPRKGSPVWTMGHRNVQGLAFDDTGQLWATEFGRDTWDELNRIDKARNYGWPLVEGKGDLEEYRNPYVQWATEDASPSGLAFLDGSLWAGALRGGRLWQVPVEGSGTGRPRDFFVGDFGRLRTVVAAPDGNLWVTTSNRDGRGDPRSGDDRILVVAPR
ncbi:MAG TPA: PQQ-dependent sugar dehydrogenase [Nocardioidaceae bacterium]|nr:PQQ-dependent sugar dehydrogenase [Nocardioidaceae bacterium]